MYEPDPSGNGVRIATATIHFPNVDYYGREMPLSEYLALLVERRDRIDGAIPNWERAVALKPWLAVSKANLLKELAELNAEIARVEKWWPSTPDAPVQL